MRLRTIPMPAAFLLLISCASGAEPPERTSTDLVIADSLRAPNYRCAGGAPPHCTEYDVSIVDLLAHPAAFHGRQVRLSGFVRLEFEGTAVYLGRDDYEYGLSRNGLWLDVPHEQFMRAGAWRGGYATVVGTFDATLTGHFGMWSGGLREITRLDSLPNFSAGIPEMPFPDTTR